MSNLWTLYIEDFTSTAQLFVCPLWLKNPSTCSLQSVLEIKRNSRVILQFHFFMLSICLVFLEETETENYIFPIQLKCRSDFYFIKIQRKLNFVKYLSRESESKNKQKESTQEVCYTCKHLVTEIWF